MHQCNLCAVPFMWYTVATLTVVDFVVEACMAANHAQCFDNSFTNVAILFTMLTTCLSFLINLI